MTNNKDISKLTDKQKRFAEEYTIDLNATQAAIRAGYSKKAAKEQGYENLTKTHIQSYISELQNTIQERNKITIDDCVTMLTDMAKFKLSDLLKADGTLKPLNEMSPEAMLVIEGIDIEEIKEKGSVVGYSKKLKISNRRSNIIELMKHLGGYKEDNEQKSNVFVDMPSEERNKRIAELIAKNNES